MTPSPFIIRFTKADPVELVIFEPYDPARNGNIVVYLPSKGREERVAAFWHQTRPPQTDEERTQAIQAAERYRRVHGSAFECYECKRLPPGWQGKAWLRSHA